MTLPITQPLLKDPPWLWALRNHAMHHLHHAMRHAMRDAPWLGFATHQAITATQDKSAHATTNVKSLSGGEQAFTTLSLALAMWQFSHSPVRAMDEVDKNMDATFLRATLKLPV